MNKKILIGSIIAVAILVLVSFTGVVGYQTTKSSTNAKASPLFAVRSSRAIDEENKDFVCDYVGKGEESVLSIPERDTQQYMLGKLINKVRKMDDKSYDRFVELVKAYVNQKDKTNDKEIAFVSIQPIPFCILLWIFAIPMYIIVQLFFMIPLRILCLFIPIPGLPTFN